MAPEMLDDRNYGYNYLVDNFSLGCIMFFMLRGSLPFDSYDPGTFNYLNKRWYL